MGTFYNLIVMIVSWVDIHVTKLIKLYAWNGLYFIMYKLYLNKIQWKKWTHAHTRLHTHTCMRGKQWQIWSWNFLSWLLDPEVVKSWCLFCSWLSHQISGPDLILLPGWFSFIKSSYTSVSVMMTIKALCKPKSTMSNQQRWQVAIAEANCALAQGFGMLFVSAF